MACLIPANNMIFIMVKEITVAGGVPAEGTFYVF